MTTAARVVVTLSAGTAAVVLAWSLLQEAGERAPGTVTGLDRDAEAASRADESWPPVVPATTPAPAPLEVPDAAQGPTDGPESPQVRALREQLAAVVAERDALKDKVAKVERDLLWNMRYIAHMTRERLATKAIEHFKASPEYDELWSDAEREEITNYLLEFPVILKPGEATFLGERIRYNDWAQFLPEGERIDVASTARMVFGMERLEKELPPNVLRVSSLGDGFRPPR